MASVILYDTEMFEALMESSVWVMSGAVMFRIKTLSISKYSARLHRYLNILLTSSRQQIDHNNKSISMWLKTHQVKSVILGGNQVKHAPRQVPGFPWQHLPFANLRMLRGRSLIPCENTSLLPSRACSETSTRRVRKTLRSHLRRRHPLCQKLLLFLWKEYSNKALSQRA